MLSKPHRLPTPDVKQVTRFGRRLTSPHLALMYRNNTVGIPRFAFIVSKKIDKRATERNRIRRLLRESVQQILPQMAACDGVLVARKNIAALVQTEVNPLVLDLLGKANLL